MASDSTVVEVRHFSEEKIQDLKSDQDLVYATGPAAISLWERFKMWLARILSSILETAATTNWTRVLIYFISGVILVYVVLRLLKIDAIRMLYAGSDKGLMKASTLEEDIHEMDFDKLISEAIDRREFRVAIRLIFLNALKLLSDNHHIHWIPGKTNHDYMEELRKADLKGGFGELNFYFEYAWYGNFNIHEETLNRVKRIFSDWKTKVNG